MTTLPSRGVLLFLGLITASLLLVVGEPASAGAQTAPCTVPGSYGHDRSCTFLERYGQCLTNAYSSYDDCLAYAGRRSSALSRSSHRVGCGIGVQVDLFVCHLGLPYYFFKQIQVG